MHPELQYSNKTYNKGIIRHNIFLLVKYRAFKSLFQVDGIMKQDVK